MESDALCYRYVGINKPTARVNSRIIHIETCEHHFIYRPCGHLVNINRCKSLLTAEIYLIALAYGGIPIELAAQQPVNLSIIGEGIILGIHHRQTVVGGNPQTTITALYDTLHTIVCQSVLSGI